MNHKDNARLPITGGAVVTIKMCVCAKGGASKLGRGSSFGENASPKTKGCDSVTGLLHNLRNVKSAMVSWQD